MNNQPSLFPVADPRPRGHETPVGREIDRLSANAERVLEFLTQRGRRGATNVELSTPEVGGLAAVRRCWDLQQSGWLIEKAHVSRGIWKYTLVGRK